MSLEEDSQDRLPRFLADDMVRRLARWLRTIGYDTAYPGALPDEQLADWAKKENRILLTRDTGFAGRFPGVRVFSMREENPWHQLVLVARRFQLDLQSGFLTRCTLCNTPVRTVRKEDYRDRIPVRAYHQATEFRFCPGCGHLYWDGSHVQRMRWQLEEIRRAVENPE